MKLISAKYQDRNPGEFSPGMELKIWVSLLLPEPHDKFFDKFFSTPDVQQVFGEAFVNNIMKPAIKIVDQERGV